MVRTRTGGHGLTLEIRNRRCVFLLSIHDLIDVMLYLRWRQFKCSKLNQKSSFLLNNIGGSQYILTPV